MRIGIPKEIFASERRVAGTPRTVKRLIAHGFEVCVESGAGEAAEHIDSAYTEVGAKIIGDPVELWGTSDIILKVRPPAALEGGSDGVALHEADRIREGACLICFIWPAEHPELLKRLADRRVTAIAMDRVPRITRAQRVDALSAMANAAGYRAVIEAANVYPRFFAGQTTAAGTVAPAKVLVIGAGVAGLAAIGAARGLGAVVRAFDTRPEVGEQVRSMGAEFLDFKPPAEIADEVAGGGGGYAKAMSDAYLEAELKLFAQQAMEVDIIITTALIPGKEAPKLITAGMVESMREGAVIVDLAAQQGGNCTLTEPDRVVSHHGVRIIGYTDLPSRMAIQTSWLYGSTLVNMVEEMGGGGVDGASGFRVDVENEVVAGALVAHEGRVLWPPPPRPVGNSELPPQPWNEGAAPQNDPTVAAVRKKAAGLVWLAVAGFLIVGIGWAADESFLRHLTVFVLACFIGWQVVWNVTPSLHTPLMSVTNAISGIIILGGMLHISGALSSPATLLGVVAVFIAAINIFGGLLVTRRMLAMFHR